jgi:hypothetical protein
MLKFGSLAFLTVYESLSRLLLAIVIVSLGYDDYVATALPLSIMLASVGGYIAIKRMHTETTYSTDAQDVRFPLPFTRHLMWDRQPHF